MNLLQNPSFENGWQDVGNSQHPNHYEIQWHTYPEHENPVDPAAWSRFQLGEARVLHTNDLPEPSHPHHIAIPDGDHLSKLFAGSKSIWFLLKQTVIGLTPGVHSFSFRVLPDLVQKYLEDGGKEYAPDPMSGRVRMWMGDDNSGWISPSFGEWQEMLIESHLEATSVQVAIEVMAPHPLQGNNWFFDDLHLERVEEVEQIVIDIPPGRRVNRVVLELE